jgi:hypothetical protein
MANKALLRHLEASENTGKPAQSVPYIKKVRWKPGLSWLRMQNMLRWVTVNPMGETVFHSVPGYTKACAPPRPCPHILRLLPLYPPYNCCKLLRGTLAGSGQALRP